MARSSHWWGGVAGTLCALGVGGGALAVDFDELVRLPKVVPEEVNDVSLVGRSLSIGSGRIIAGALGENNFQGAVYIMERSGANWMSTHRLEADDGEMDDEFGTDVDIDGDVAIVGAACDDNPAGTDAGAAYIFVRNPMTDTWSQENKFLGGAAMFGAEAGQSVAVDNGRIAYGSPNEDGMSNLEGAVYVWNRFDSPKGVIYVFEGRITPDVPVTSAQFGWSLDLEGNTMVVGAISEDQLGAGGAVYVFERISNMWQQTDRLTAPGGAPTSNFGFSVAIDGNTIAVGAPTENDNADRTGAMYFYTRTGMRGTGNWSFEQRVTASDRMEDDFMGEFVAIDGSLAVTASRGVDERGMDAGAAYLFERTGAVGSATWTEFDKLFADAPTENGQFSRALAMEGDTIAIAENQDSDQASGAGGVHMFWLLTYPYPPDPGGCPADLDGSGDVGAGDLAELLGLWGPCP